MRCLLALLTLLPLFTGGCSLDIDSDSLVRELRVLAIRAGDPEPGSESDVQATISLSGGGDLVFTRDHIDLAALVAAPTGPGRRIAAPRPLRYDWYLCIGLASLTVPGTLDPACNKFLPSDPPPEMNPALLLLGSGERLRLPTAVLKEAVGRLLQVQLAMARGSGAGMDMGTGTGMDMGTGMEELPKAMVLPLPVLVRASAVSGDPKDSRDSEAAFTFLRVIVALPGMSLPPPNHNPVFRSMVAGPTSRDTEGAAPMQALMPCSAQAMLDGSCSRYLLGRDETVFLVGSAQDGSLERYTPLDASGRGEISERMRYSWFVTDGEFKEERTGDAQPENQWKSEGKRPAPPEVQVVQVFFVLQDERGGADWSAFELALKP